VTMLVNGVRGGGSSPLDRGLHFGDGLFETIACLNRNPRFLSLHLERLVLGCERLRIDVPDIEDIRAEVLQLAREVDRAIIKVLVTRGVAAARGYAPAGSERATRITIRYPWPHEDRARMHDGVRVRSCTLRLGENPLLAGLKHCNRLEQILARAEWSADSDIVEGILYSSCGRLVSGTMSNLFIVRDSAVLTPRIDRCGVAGVMRRVVMSESGRAGITTRECPLGVEDLRSADEVFLTNARIGIWPVREIDNVPLTPGPVTRHLQEILAPLLDEPVHA
jgi:4-amino-4-deoxychorismate lyase